MGTRLIHQTTPVARKTHYCNACEFVFNGDINRGFTFSEYRAIIKARNNGYRILKGEKYIRQFIGDSISGEVWSFKAIPDIHAICLKYDFYED